MLLLVLAGCASDTTPSASSAQREAAGRADERVAFVSSLFSGAEQYENFGRLAQIMPTNRIAAPSKGTPFPLGAPLEIPATFEHDGTSRDTAKFLEVTDTAALLVIHDGKLRRESYWLTGGQGVRWMSMSVGKSFVSALVGAALQDGAIRSIDEPVTAYVPELAGSAYDGVRIKDILQMSSGAKWNEDYSDANSDIARLAGALASGASLNEFTTTLVREREPGTHNHYNSTDTQVLGWLLRRATGKSLAAYAEEKLWRPLGMEADGYWIADDSGMEMAFGGLQVSARDYAKFGELYRLGGIWHGTRVLDAAWVHASVTPDAPHLMPGQNLEFPLGYGYQWWVLDGGEGEFSAIGVYNQFVYVNPARRVVIVKLSANSAYGTTAGEDSSREMETFSLLREIAKAAE
jgi:CubicO group peptidase (beta-lactamase class C family)